MAERFPSGIFIYTYNFFLDANKTTEYFWDSSDD